MENPTNFYDKQGDTLNAWFDDPEEECICGETREGEASA